MSYSFRIKFTRSPTDTIQTDAFELQVLVPNQKVSIALKNLVPEQSIKDAEQLALSGHGYSSSQEAFEAAEQYQLALMVALARVRVGADFGQRAAKSLCTEYGLEWLEQQVGHRVLNNTHGLMVFATDPKPLFVTASAKMVRGANADAFQALLLEAIAKRPILSDREQLAFSLFNASFFQPRADSRFILLVMAVEALIEPIPRSTEARVLVEQLITQTQGAKLPPTERDSVLGSLRWLLQESINQAGKRLVTDRLGGREYKDMPASRFFLHAYQLRSNLVHGNLPYPTFEEVSNICAPLEIFVSDLLTSPALGRPR